MDWLILASSGAAAGSPAQALWRDLIVMLIAAAVVAVVLQRLKLATIPAYLITGAIIGPGALGVVRSADSVQAISDLALVLLLFGVGLHLDVNVLAQRLKMLLAATLVSSGACVAVLWPASMLLGISPPAALVVAMAMSISSTVVVLRVLQQRRELGYPEGRLAFAVLVLQDMVAIVMLMLLPPLAKFAGTGTAAASTASSGSTLDLALSLIAGGSIAIAAIGGIILIGRFVMPRLLTEAARSKSSEVLIVLSTAAALGAAALTQGVIGNAAMGAFLAGFMLSTTPFRHQISGQVGAIRDLFGAVFFTAIGMSVNAQALIEHLPTVLIGAVVLLVLKSVAMGLSFWVVGSTGNVSLRAGIALSQAGEFSVLMLAAAAAPTIGLISQETVGTGIAIIVVSLIATPALIQASAAINRRLPAILPPPWGRADKSIHRVGKGSDGARPMRAIIAGYGLVGRAVADELGKLGVTSTIVELNPATVRKQTELGRSVVFGDVSNREVLESAGIHKADVLILTIPDEDSVFRAVRMAKEIKPDVYVVVRAGYVSQGIMAAGLGADGVVVEEMATAKEMERAVRILIDRRRVEGPEPMADTLTATQTGPSA